jgi:Molybdopterin converting factor, small subunit
MTVTVRFFASYADTLGVPSMSVEIGNGETVADVLRAVELLPGASMLPPSPLVAVNHSYARLTDVLSNGDEIAVIPPVAGG